MAKGKIKGQSIGPAPYRGPKVAGNAEGRASEFYKGPARGSATRTNAPTGIADPSFVFDKKFMKKLSQLFNNAAISKPAISKLPVKKTGGR